MHDWVKIVNFHYVPNFRPVTFFPSVSITTTKKFHIFFKVRSSNPDSSDILFPDSDDDFDQDIIIDDIDEKAAPWWEQQEEAAKRRCQSSCTVSSKGVKPTINLCDDTDVSQNYI